MKKLNDILSCLSVKEVIVDANPVISHITFNSNDVQKGSLFFAVKGVKTDGHKYIVHAIEKGAIAIVCEVLPDKTNKEVVYIVTPDSSEALALVASAFYDHPSKRIKLIGVTGTNGKTTIATLLYQLFTKLGFDSGLISTVRYISGFEEFDATHTTPDAIRINKLINNMTEKGCAYCFMEISSHAIMQNRIAGLHFCGGIFTNITHDHLDYHSSFMEYLNTKKSFFDSMPSDAWVITNNEDKNGKVMVQNTKASISSFSTRGIADFKCTILENSMEGLNLEIDGNKIWTRLSGEFNAKNLIAVYAVAKLEGLKTTEILPCLSDLTGAEGRFQKIRNKQEITGIIDYAHSPDALENVLKTISKSRSDAKQVITVVGAGGDRDSFKRPKMAVIAATYSDQLILTSDNPRSEDPEKIIDNMEEGLDPIEKRKVLRITSRNEAIKTACRLAEPGDIILVAGKGHEKYQEIKGVKHPFDDFEVLKNYLTDIN